MKQRDSIEIHHTNASSNRWKLIQQQRVHENCDKLKLHASIKVIHEISLLGRDSCYRRCMLLCVSHWSSNDIVNEKWSTDHFNQSFRAKDIDVTNNKSRFTFHELLWFYLTFCLTWSLKLLLLRESQTFMTQRKTVQRKFLRFLNAV